MFGFNILVITEAILKMNDRTTKLESVSGYD